MSRTPLGTCLMYRPSLVLLFLVLLAPAGCRDGLDFRVVEVVMEGAEDDDGEVATMDIWGLTFTGTEDGGSSWIPIWGDAEIGGEYWGVFVPVYPSDGDRLVFRAEDFAITLAGVTVALDLEGEEPGGWDWLAKATPEEKAALRLVYAEEPVTPEQFALLQDLSVTNPNLGLVTEDPDFLSRLLEIFDPVSLPFVDMPLSTESLPLLIGEPELRRLSIDGSELTELGFLRQFQRLEEVVLGNWDPANTGPFPDSIPGLKAIQIFDWDEVDLRDLGRQPGLEELTILGCNGDGLSDLRPIAGFPKLRLVAFRSCEVADLGPLAGLKNLRWLALHSGATQADLEQVALLLPDLEFLELFELEDVTDLSPLTRMENLRGLILETEAPPDPLFEMDQLEYLALSIDSDEESPYGEHIIPRLQAELPETVLARVEGFCLGSGYILLLFPMVGLVWFILGRRRKEREGLGLGS